MCVCVFHDHNHSVCVMTNSVIRVCVAIPLAINFHTHTSLFVLGAIKSYHSVCISGHERADSDRWACILVEKLDVIS